MIPEELVIRKMYPDEVRDIAIEWAALEGWNPGLHDAKCFYEADPDGFLVGLINNEPVACISLVRYNEKFSFLGFYIVKPEFRGKGLGIRLWNHAISENHSDNTGLDGVIAQQKNYVKSGFKLFCRNIRYEGISKHLSGSYKNIFTADKISFENICKYDLQVFPAARERFLKCWLNQPASFALVSVEDDELTGYGMIRRCRSGYKIGPLFADNEKIAQELFSSLLQKIPADSIFYFDVPETNHDSVVIAERAGMVKVFETARMYTGESPDIDNQKVFGVTTFELG